MIEIRNLVVVYESTPLNVVANRDLSLDISNCGLLVITGPNGSGKSTLFQVLSGNLQPTAGQIIVEGNLISNREIQRTLANFVEYSPQDFTLDLERSGAQIARNSNPKRLARILKALEINEYWNSPIESLTREERQLVGLTLSLVSTKKVLLLDEPTKYLGKDSSIRLLELLRELSGEQSVVIATHDPTWTKREKSSVHIQDGRVVQSRGKNLADSFGWKFTGLVAKPKSLNALDKHKNIRNYVSLTKFLSDLRDAGDSAYFFDPEIKTLDEITPRELFMNQGLQLPYQLRDHADQRILNLSGGERSWSYLWSILGTEPRRIFLLYPSLNLDQASQGELREKILKLANSGSKISIFDIN